jgi:hypothetical protein
MHMKVEMKLQIDNTQFLMSILLRYIELGIFAAITANQNGLTDFRLKINIIKYNQSFNKSEGEEHYFSMNNFISTKL